MTLRKDSHEVTVKGLAKLVGISPGSMRKALSRKHQDQDWLLQVGKPSGFDHGVNDVLPGKVVKSILNERGKAPVKKSPDQPKSQPKPEKKVKPLTKKAPNPGIGWDLLTAGSVLVIADGAAAGWIGQQAYQNAWFLLFFFPVGLAIGYAALKIVIEEKGKAKEWQKDPAQVWAWGFGVFQFLLHAAAFDLFAMPGTDLSFYVGKWVLAVAIPLGAAGVAFSARKRLNR
jgi:hypothetical protein